MPKLPIAERRAALVEAAIAVALREGFVRMTTRQVAAEAGVAVGVLHYCFGTREALLRDVITRFVGDTHASLDQVFADGGDLRAHLTRAADLFCAAIEQAPEQHLLQYELTTLAVREPEFADLGTWQYDSYRAESREFLERLAGATAITWTVPIDVLARMLLAQNDGITLAWLVDRDGDRARADFAAFADVLCGLATPRTD